MANRALVVGLGNPGRQHQRNRHNVGFQIVDHLAARHGLVLDRMQNGASVGIGQIDGYAVLLAKPQGYMNRSGISVGAIQRFYKVPLERMLVIYDDLDLPLGTIRLRPVGGSGGQNGMNSIIERLGTQEFGRMRVGIGRPPGRMDPAAYVLQDFRGDEWQEIQLIWDRAADAVETWLHDGIELAMSRHNAPNSLGDDKGL